MNVLVLSLLNIDATYYKSSENPSCIVSTIAVNRKVNRLYERRLEALLLDETSIYKDMLPESNDITVHVKNIQKLVVMFNRLLSFCSKIEIISFPKGTLHYDLQSYSV